MTGVRPIANQRISLKKLAGTPSAELYNMSSVAHARMDVLTSSQSDDSCRSIPPISTWALCSLIDARRVWPMHAQQVACDAGPRRRRRPRTHGVLAAHVWRTCTSSHIPKLLVGTHSVPRSCAFIGTLTRGGIRSWHAARIDGACADHHPLACRRPVPGRAYGVAAPALRRSAHGHGWHGRHWSHRGGSCYCGGCGGGSESNSRWSQGDRFKHRHRRTSVRSYDGRFWGERDED
eukprot:COSAG02_NODE_7920_length_2786_cov_5.442129_3_plen_234_part_00